MQPAFGLRRENCVILLIIWVYRTYCAPCAHNSQGGRHMKRVLALMIALMLAIPGIAFSEDASVDEIVIDDDGMLTAKGT